MRFSGKNQLSSAERKSIYVEVFLWIKKANYIKAYRISRKYKKRYPADFGICANYACVLGDYAEMFPGSRKRKLQRKSVELMKDLLFRTRCESNKRVIETLKNEYYWQTKNRKKQYELGVSRVKAGNKSGYYSQGVGAAWQSYELAKKEQKFHARRWANMAVRAWKQYEKVSPGYYNSYVHRALAEGVSGEIANMEMSLKKAGKLSNKEASYSEFANIRDLVAKL